MYLGTSQPFTRSGQVITPDSGVTVGAIHFSVTGYSSVNVQNGSLDTDYDLEDGFNLLTFANSTYSTLTLTFTGTGVVDWTTLAIYETTVDLTNEIKHHRPRIYQPEFAPVGGGEFSAPNIVVGDFSFEWRYLSWAKVDELEELFQKLFIVGADPQVVLIPDGYESAHYDVVITSPFNFYPSVGGNFNSGASGAMVFSTVGAIS